MKENRALHAEELAALKQHNTTQNGKNRLHQPMFCSWKNGMILLQRSSNNLNAQTALMTFCILNDTEDFNFFTLWLNRIHSTIIILYAFFWVIPRHLKAYNIQKTAKVWNQDYYYTVVLLYTLIIKCGVIYIVHMDTMCLSYYIHNHIFWIVTIHVVWAFW